MNGILNFSFESYISFSYEMMHEYVVDLEKSINKKQNKEVYSEFTTELCFFEELYPKNGESYKTSTLSYFLDWQFVVIQRTSALISLYSIFETDLNNLCIREQKENILSFKDINGRGIQRSTKYLEKVAHYNMKKNSDLWNEIQNISKIRNLLVHRNMIIKTDGEKNILNKISIYPANRKLLF